MRGRRATWLAALWALPFLVVVMLFDALPMASVVAGSVYGDNGWSLGNFATILSSRFYRGAFETSIGLSLLTSAIGLVIGFPLSLALYRRSSGGF